MKSENVEGIQEATQRLERIASQLTLAMLNPVAEHNSR